MAPLFRTTLGAAVGVSVLSLTLVGTSSPAAAVTCADTSQGPNFGGGSGTDSDPYLVATAAHLEFLRDTTTIYSCAFRQTSDITLTSTWTTSIGDATDPFIGIYDGSRFSIDALSVTRASDSFVGIFGVLDAGGILVRVRLTNANVSGGSQTGALVGATSVGSTVRHSSSAGAVTRTGGSSAIVRSTVT